MKLVLFDIDGTLLSSSGAGRRAMEAALSLIFGSAGSPLYRYDGKTDRQIVRELMRAEGHDDERIDREMPNVIEMYVDFLRAELLRPETRVTCYAGVVALLDALEERDDRVTGLLTGNLRHGAHAKLEAAGIDPARFRASAFGSDHEARHELPGIAQRRAREELGLEFGGESIIIIGDTPSDIACGRGIGARAIAVATGHYSVAELEGHSPCRVFPDLGDTSAVMAAIDDA